MLPAQDAPRVVMVCVDKAEASTRIVELTKAEFPAVPIVARAIDRRHSIDLLRATADVQVRETFECALVMGAAALDRLGASQAEIAEIRSRILDWDRRRFELELERGIDAGKALFSRRVWN
jgi:glutathione-regulated potassium-efflux system protein KefB